MSLLRWFKLLSNNNNEATYTEESGKVSLDIEPTSSTTNLNGDKAIRVVVTAAANPDLTGPTDINLSNQTIVSGSPIGTVVGSLTTVNGTGPFTYTITSDPDNKFDIVGNDLVTDQNVDFATDPSHDVTIMVTDDNANTFSKLFTITVTAAPVYSNDFSMNFNGVDEYVQTTYDFSGKSQFTINTYLYRSSTNDRIDISQSNSGNSDRVKILRNNNGSAVVVIDDGIATYTENTTGWKMFTLVYDGTQPGNNKVTFYIDGVQATASNFNGTFPATIANNSLETFNLGFDKGSGSYGKGNIDETSVWGVLLNQTEVTELYNSGTPLNLNTHSQAANLESWWRMGEQLSVTTIPDQKGSDDGTLINMNSANRDTNVP